MVRNGWKTSENQYRAATAPDGPDLFNMKEVVIISEGVEKRVTVDRKYLKRSILDPEFEKVKEYQTRTMPKPEISKKDVEILIDYIIGLNEE